MIRILPDGVLEGSPCCVVATACAMKGGFLKSEPKTKAGGYVTLREADRYFREHLSIRKQIYYKRNERLKLKDLHLQGNAIVCVLGHYVYLEGETYWSFFDNENDDVVAVWLLE